MKNAITSCDRSVNGGWLGRASENHVAVPVEAIADDLVLTRGDARVEITLRPFALTVCRGGRRLLRSVGFWVADGSVADQFVHLTEGSSPLRSLGRGSGQ
ncbi:MAG TPA: hypothetical protein VII87_10865 [Solirubrobacteraceae bacterium]